MFRGMCDNKEHKEVAKLGSAKTSILMGLDMLDDSRYFINSEKIKDILGANQDTKLLEEMNELSHDILKFMVHKGTSYEDLKPEERENIVKEIGDVFITLMGFIGRHNVNITDIENAVTQKLNKFNKAVFKLEENDRSVD